MVEDEEDFQPDRPRPVAIRQCLALLGEGRSPDFDYPVGLLEIDESGEGEPFSIAVIAVTTFENRVVVALPRSAWHRTVKQRLLSPRALSKVFLVQGSFVDRGDGGAELSGQYPFWLGLLSPEFEELVTFDSDAELPECTFPFNSEGALILPTVESLAELVDKHFAFVTASSGGAAAGSKRTGSLDQRLQALEASVEKLVERLGEPAAHPRPSALKSTSKAAPCLAPPGLAVDVQVVEGLDLEVVRSARAAGIPEEQIQEMASVAKKGRPRLADLPVPVRKPKVVGELSDSEEDADVGLQTAAETGASSTDEVAAAVTKLTQIASYLTMQRQKSRSLDALLDGAGGVAMGESSTSLGSKKYSAALRALRKTLLKQPEEISKVVEKNLTEDFQMMAQLPGSSAIPISTRGWLEMRSKVQNYATPVRLLWGVAGMVDALRAGRAEEAKARGYLILAQGDQLSIDRGSWTVASELALEEPPPFAAFQSHLLPQETEQPFTKLVDGRWLDLILSKLQDMDNLNERKKKLSGRRALPAADSLPTADPKKKGGKDGKGKEKGKGKGEKASEGEVPPAA